MLTDRDSSRAALADGVSDVHAGALREQDRQQRLEHASAHRRRSGDARSAGAIVPVARTDDDPRHDVDPGMLDGLGEPRHDLLGQLVARPTIRSDLLLGRHRLGDPDAGRSFGLGAGQGADPVGFARTEQPGLLGLGGRQGRDLRSLLLGTRQVGAALIGLDRDRQLRLGDRLLLTRAGLGLPQLALLDGGRLLTAVGLDLLEGDLP